MKVLFVCSGNYLTDNSSLVLSQANSLKAKNIEVDIYYIKGKGIIGYLKNILPLRKQIKKNYYDIIHAHYGLSGWDAFFAKNRKVKLIISFMGNDLLGDHANNGKSTIYGNLLVSLNKLLAKQANHNIVKSKVMFEKIAYSITTVIPNGVNLNLFQPVDREECLRKVGWDPNLKHILFLSRPDRPEKNFTLTKKAIEKLDNKSVQLHILEQIPHNDLVYYYNAANVCVLTSYHEGSPNVIKEAMACNCSIVCTDVGDVREVFGNTKGCYICNFDSSDVALNLKTAIEFVIKSEKTKGRQRIIELGLDSESIANRIIEVYKKALNIKTKN